MSVQLEEVMYDEDPEALKELIKKGVDPSELGNWALRYAEENELPAMVKVLKADGRVRNYENFMEAVKRGDLKDVKKYHSKLTGIIDELSTNNALLIARNKGFTEIEDFLYEDPRIQLQEKVYDKAFPREIAVLLQEDLVMNDPGTFDTLKTEEYQKVYEAEVLRRKRKGVLDTAIGLRSLKLEPIGGRPERLPIYVVEEIINKAYDTRGTLGLQEVIPRIQNIFY